MYDIVSQVKADCDFQRKLLGRYQRECEELPKGVLCVKEKKGKHYFYKQTFHDGARCQMYIPKKNEEYVEALKIRRFLEESMKIFQKNIQAEEQFLRRYQSYDPNLIQASLPGAYRPLPNRCFWEAGNQNQIQWLKNTRRDKQRNPEKKIHITPGGLCVQSKGELIIAASLEANGIPFRYDQELRLGEHVIHPDFELLDPYRNIPIYWEHFGMLEDEDYFESAVWKLKLYQKNGIFLFDRLLVTANAPDGSFNGKMVDRIIKVFLCG